MKFYTCDSEYALKHNNVKKTLIFDLQVAKPEKRIKCTLIPGDGVGPELVYSVQEVFKVNTIFFARFFT